MARSSSSMPSMSIGNVVSAGLRLYGTHLKQYLKIALTATGWALLPWLVLIPPLLLSLGMLDTPGRLILMWLVVVLVWVFLLVFCLAKSLMHTATIARLAYGELREQPETLKEVQAELAPRLWKFLRVWFFVVVLLFGVNIGVSFVQTFLGGVIGFLWRNEAIAAAIAGILQLLGMGLYLWFTARWSIPDVAMAVENNKNSTDSIIRSWELTEGSAFQVLSALFVAWLITLPLYAISMIPLFGSMIPLTQLGRDPNPNDGAYLQIMGSFLIGVSLSSLLSIFFGIFTVPFWQSVKTLIYFDLRNRREGADLKLRDR